MTPLAPALSLADTLEPLALTGVVSAVRGLSVLVDELAAPVGTMVRISNKSGRSATLGEVVGFTREHTIVMLLGGSGSGDTKPTATGGSGGISAGDPVSAMQAAPMAMVGSTMLGRVVNGLGEPLDDKGPLRELHPRPLSPAPLSPMKRRRISDQLTTGVRAVDLMTPLGKGQRMGIFAGPGVGKSSLLSSIARNTNATMNVIALIGERGREVKDFIEHALGAEGLTRSVVIVATGDESPLMRIRASKLACTVAEYFRDSGGDVLLMMDSITRFAHAQRQIGLSAGEPPATKGYVPSVFSQMALILERAGSVEWGGSITGLYTILVEGDDMTEPIADAARGILDGHLILSRKLAQKGHFPAIDVLDSVSRVADDVASKDHVAARQNLLRLLATYRDVEDLVQIGAYAKGSNPTADIAIEMQSHVNSLLRQGKGEEAAFANSLATMLKLAKAADELATKKPQKQAARP